jgi:hypothetical protein
MAKLKKYPVPMVHLAMRDLEEKYSLMGPSQNLTLDRVLADLTKRLDIRKEAHENGEDWAM